MLRNETIWANFAQDAHTERTTYEIRALATYRAYQKLGVLNPYLSEEEAIEIFSEAYQTFHYRFGDLGGRMIVTD